MWDATIRKNHCRFRVQDPVNGQFLTRDPLEYAGGPNLYEYTASRPFDMRDPFGLIYDDMLERPRPPTPKPVVPREGRPGWRAPYDIYPGDRPEDIVKRQEQILGPSKVPKVPYQRPSTGKMMLQGASDALLCACEVYGENILDIATLGLVEVDLDFRDRMFDPDNPDLAITRVAAEISCFCAEFAVPALGCV